MDAKLRRAALGLLLPLAASPARADGLTISHEPVRCFLAGRWSRVGACIEPESGLARARLVFRARGAAAWHAVEMLRAGERHAAVLPKPEAGIRVEYCEEARR